MNTKQRCSIAIKIHSCRDGINSIHLNKAETKTVDRDCSKTLGASATVREYELSVSIAFTY